MSEVLLPPAEALEDARAPHILEVLLNGVDTPDPSADASKERVLEVVQVFGDAVVDLKHFARGRGVSLGATLVKSLRGTRNAEDFFVPTSLLPEAASHGLFQADGEGWACVVAPGWEGWVEGPAGRRSFATLAAMVTPGADGLLRLPIGPEDRAVIEVGTSIFVARPVHPSKRVPITGRDGIDYPLLGITGFMGFVAMMLGVALSVVPTPSKSSSIGDDSKLVEIMLQRQVDIPKPPAPAPGPSGERAKGREGKRGEEQAKAEQSRAPINRQQVDREVTDNAGVLGALNNNAALEAMLGDVGLSADIQTSLTGIIGPRATQMGAGGLGQRGTDFGGGGKAEGMAGLDSWGRGPGAGGRFKPGGGGVKQDGGPANVDTGEVITVGALDKALIDQVVKRNMAQIRYCYQRELTKNPALQGKVAVKFVIAKDGSVSSATTKTSTLANAAVESCINGRFMRFQFPEPKGGGIVIVSYPFLFSPG